MLRIKNDKTPETLGNIPTLDFLNDLYKEDKLNSAQYGALIRLYKEVKDCYNDGVFEVVNSQLYIAETVGI